MFLGGPLGILGFIASGFASSAPWFVNVFWSNGGVAKTPLSLSFLFIAQGDGAPTSVTLHYDFCGTVVPTSSTCDDLRYILLGLHIVYSLGSLVSLAGSVLCFLKIFAAIPLLAAALTLEGAAIFGFFFRALPTLEKHLEEQSSTVSVSWNFHYSSFVALGGFVLTFLALTIASLLARSTRKALFDAERAKAREPTAVTVESGGAALTAQQEAPVAEINAPS